MMEAMSQAKPADIEPLPPNPENYPMGSTIRHRCWTVASEPEEMVLSLVRSERRWRMETWALLLAHYVPTYTQVNLDAERKDKIETATRPAPDDPPLNADSTTDRNTMVEGMGHLRARYVAATTEGKTAVWVDEAGRAVPWKVDEEEF
jgi:hypothetical protein